MITLDVIKDALRVDFNDWNDQLEDLLESSLCYAESVTGRDRDDFNGEVIQAVIDDVRKKFAGEESQAIVVFRRYSKRPMF